MRKFYYLLKRLGSRNAHTILITVSQCHIIEKYNRNLRMEYFVSFNLFLEEN